MKNRYIPALLLFACFFTSCNKQDLTPAFLEISQEDLLNSIDISQFNAQHDMSYDNLQLEVCANQVFKDVWVYLNGENLGCWELPCKIPMLPNFGDSNIVQIYPAIRLNGLSTMVPLYPFVKPINCKLFIEQEQIYHPFEQGKKFEYTSSVTFPLIESFEQSTAFAAVDSTRPTMQVCEIDGRTTGRIHLEDTNTYFEVQTPFYILPANGVSCFWEMDFKCDNEVNTEITIITNSGTITSEPLVILRESNGDWKHIYINMTTTIGLLSTYTNETVFVRLSMSGFSKNGEPTNFYFDNLKIITLDN